MVESTVILSARTCAEDAGALLTGEPAEARPATVEEINKRMMAVMTTVQN